jgi:hypothetical protein
MCLICPSLIVTGLESIPFPWLLFVWGLCKATILYCVYHYISQIKRFCSELKDIYTSEGFAAAVDALVWFINYYRAAFMSKFVKPKKFFVFKGSAALVDDVVSYIYYYKTQFMSLFIKPKKFFIVLYKKFFSGLEF